MAILALIAGVLLFSLSRYQHYSYKERGVPDPVELSPKLRKLFSKTKDVCFGRYVITVPEEARLIFGHQEFPAKIVTHKNATNQAKQLAEAYFAKVKASEDEAELTYLGVGPVPNSVQLRYFLSDYAKKIGAQGLKNFDQHGDHVFEYGWGSGRKRPLDGVSKRMAEIATQLRVRNNAEVPTEPGVCIDEGFIADSSSNDQEIFGAGISFPSIPDANFSIMSNKDASTEGPNGVGLIERHEGAMTAQGVVFPAFAALSRLRLGRHTVNSWDGEEVLLRHNGDGGTTAHEFMWGFVGKTGDRMKPASVDIQLDTGVAHNAKFATKATLSDDEAVALWDQLLNGLRFRK